MNVKVRKEIFESIYEYDGEIQDYNEDLNSYFIFRKDTKTFEWVETKWCISSAGYST